MAQDNVNDPAHQESRTYYVNGISIDCIIINSHDNWLEN